MTEKFTRNTEDCGRPTTLTQRMAFLIVVTQIISMCGTYRILFEIVGDKVRSDSSFPLHPVHGRIGCCYGTFVGWANRLGIGTKNTYIRPLMTPLRIAQRLLFVLEEIYAYPLDLLSRTKQNELERSHKVISV